MQRNTTPERHITRDGTVVVTIVAASPAGRLPCARIDDGSGGTVGAAQHEMTVDIYKVKPIPVDMGRGPPLTYGKVAIRMAHCNTTIAGTLLSYGATWGPFVDPHNCCARPGALPWATGQRAHQQTAAQQTPRQSNRATDPPAGGKLQGVTA